MDLADEAGSVIEMLEHRRVDAVRRDAAAIPKGSPGNCYECGEPSPRLVLGNCAPCRDILEKIAKRS